MAYARDGGWDYATPWSRQGRFFGAGEVRIAILSLLAEGPKHGYRLMKELAERSGGSYRVSAGTMYPALAALEDEETAISESRDGRKVYHLTDLGAEELERERVTVDEIWRRTSDWGDWGEWIVGSPLGPLMKATFRAMRQATEEPGLRKRVERILEGARRELEDL